MSKLSVATLFSIVIIMDLQLFLEQTILYMLGTLSRIRI